ncbi:protein mono-ADP-ribosyltransferase PARP12-like [Haliotis asinina]|uniref:protein mono-ADP-ribosyltransferase PARP12-like n=1 Tax=Haliotis asinina TaxID=109174 RepID=UPI0035321710
MASNDAAAIVVMKVLCRCNCRISLQQLFSHLNKDGFKISNWQSLQKFLEKYPDVFQIQEPKHPRSLVFLSARVPICEDHSTKNGDCNQEGFCGSLHICKFFLLSDSCKFQANKCVYGHDLQTSHNLQVLQPYFMDELSDAEIKRILRCIENRTFLTKPGICDYYNVKQGCNRMNCSFLHLCRHYLTGECHFGSKCRRSHNIHDPNVSNILAKYGINCQRPDDDILDDLRILFEMSDDRPLARHSSVTSLPDLPQPPSRGPRCRSLGPKRNRRVSSPSPARSDAAYEPQDQYGGYGYPYAVPPGSARNAGNEYWGPMRAGHGSYPFNMSGPQGPYAYPPNPYPTDIHPPRNTGYGPPNVHPNPFGSPARNQRQPFSHHSEPHGPWTQQPGSQRIGARPRGKVQDPPDQDQGPRNDGAQPKAHQKRSQSVGRPFKGKQVSEISDKDTLDICTFFLKGKCWYGDNCLRHHKDMIYQWQFRKKQASAKHHREWKDFDEEDNTNIEMNFCQPNKIECFVKLDGVIKVTFTDDPMTGSGQDTEMDIRRLSTLSSEDPSATPVVHKWITDWKWYWENQFGEWTEYGVKDFRGFTSSINSEAIEQAYLADPKGSIEFSTLEYTYKLNFSTMTQENTQVKTERNVRRRPYFYKKEDLKNRNMAPSSDNVEVPDVWSCKNFKSAKQLFAHFSSHEVDDSSEEYKKIKDLFYKTLSSSSVIKSIKRIENGELWANYYVKMAQMAIKAGKPVKQMSLFHGTLEQYIDPICHQGFDSRFSGRTTGTRHGRGSYFARDAKYSDSYSEQTKSQKKMFVAKVLVGESAKGKPDYVRPPPKSAQNEYELYDSCVDNTSDPSIFVIFSPEQSYPEYLISYV